MTFAERWGRMVAGSDKARETAREVRRMQAVSFYSGRNGSGKSLLAVFDSLPDLDAGRRVLSTVRLLDFRNPRPCEDFWCPCDKDNPDRHGAAHPAYERWTTWQQMVDLQDGVLIADEITGVADSNEGAALPVQAADELHRLRRRDVVLRITGLNFTRANKRIREATTAVTRCRGSMPIEVLNEDGSMRAWRARRLVEWHTYDAETLPLDDLTEGAFAKAELIVKSKAYVPDMLAAKAYDTFAPVDRIGAVSDSGRCMVCTGRRPVPECSCEDYVAGKTERRARRSARREAPSTAAPTNDAPPRGPRRTLPVVPLDGAPSTA